jgi:CRISPR-associated protein Cas1
MIARSIVCHGYEPSLGIFHKSELNGFNLADDFIEPFRPLVDLAVYQLIQTADEEQQELTPSIKHDLFRLVNYDMEVGNQKHIVSNAIELFVESYSKSLRDNAESITPPVLIALKEHSYE